MKINAREIYDVVFLFGRLGLRVNKTHVVFININIMAATVKI